MVGACVAVVALLPGVAQAASGSSLGVGFTGRGVRGISVLPRTFTAGDCRQIGQNQHEFFAAEINLEPPQSGQSRAFWQGNLYTVSTVFTDTWHGKWLYRNASGGTVATVTMDGPEMLEGIILFIRQETHVALTQEQWDSIAFVDWYGDC
ncbi:hypothetical protein AB0F17_07335 [Nonomuraea sp. NPDC026600]|uniref:hypothetical protein n=1 Tax=Nonomuraea sp. NPDC026600 TaxID=3155363 RepID=UPI0033E81376